MSLKWHTIHNPSHEIMIPCKSLEGGPEFSTTQVAAILQFFSISHSKKYFNVWGITRFFQE